MPPNVCAACAIAACAPSYVSRSATKPAVSPPRRFGRDLGDEIRAIDEQHPAAFGRRAQRDAAADALRGARDDDDLARESLHDHVAFAVTLGVNFS